MWSRPDGNERLTKLADELLLLSQTLCQKDYFSCVVLGPRLAGLLPLCPGITPEMAVWVPYVVPAISHRLAACKALPPELYL